MRGGREFMTEVRSVVRAERRRLGGAEGSPAAPATSAATVDRRTVLRAGVALGGGAAVAGVTGLAWPATASAAVGGAVDRGDPVIVVGAGLAGLSAAYRLAQVGIPVEVHEAHADRVGGRCWTARGIFADGQLAEHGGEFIDSEHHEIRRLVAELGLGVEDREHPPAANVGPGQQSFEVLQGRAIEHLPSTQWVRRLVRQANKLHNYNYRTTDPYTRAFDQMSIRDWIIDNDDVTGGTGSDVAGRISWSTGDYWGGDINQVSALGLVDQFAYPVDRQADERWHVAGGNDQVPHLLRARLEVMQPGCIVMDSPLTGLRRAGTTIALRFGGSSAWRHSQHVVLALPFSALRKTDIDPTAVSALKYQAIHEQAIGANAKILLQFEQRFDHFTIAAGQRAGRPWSGVSESDLWHGDSWDSSLTQAGREGVLTIFTGGSFGANLPVQTAHGAIPVGLRTQTLDYLEGFVPGVSAAYAGRGWVDSWVDDPWTHGSYTYFAPGQYTRFSGFNGRPEGGLHFAGEHTSVEWLGYLNGGVATGERAAREVAVALKGKGILQRMAPSPRSPAA